VNNEAKSKSRGKSQDDDEEKRRFGKKALSDFLIYFKTSLKLFLLFFSEIQSDK
jgi:hypothetical protein